MTHDHRDVVEEIITLSAAVEANMGNDLSAEDTQRLEQITEWCQQSPALWEVITRIGWEINEG